MGIAGPQCPSCFLPSTRQARLSANCARNINECRSVASLSAGTSCHGICTDAEKDQCMFLSMTVFQNRVQLFGHPLASLMTHRLKISVPSPLSLSEFQLHFYSLALPAWPSPPPSQCLRVSRPPPARHQPRRRRR